VHVPKKEIIFNYIFIFNYFSFIYKLLSPKKAKKNKPSPKKG